MSFLPHTCECYICHREITDALRSAQIEKETLTITSTWGEKEEDNRHYPPYKITEFSGPEECRLKAHHTGDGWLLYVMDRHGKTIAYLAWPKNWPEILSKFQIGRFGFEVEP